VVFWHAIVVAVAVTVVMGRLPGKLAKYPKVHITDNKSKHENVLGVKHYVKNYMNVSLTVRQQAFQQV